MQKQVNKLMKENGLVLIRSKKHLVWEHLDSGLKITTSKTSSDSNALFSVKKNSVKNKCVQISSDWF